MKKIPKTKSGDSQGSVPKYPGKWQYFNMLLFLRDILRPRETEGNIPEVDTESLEPNHEDPDEEELSNLSVTDVDNETFNTKTPNFQLSSTSQVIPQVAETNSDTFSEKSISASRQMGRTATSSASVTATTSRKRRHAQTNESNVEKELLKIETKKLAILERSEDDDVLQIITSIFPKDATDPKTEGQK